MSKKVILIVEDNEGMRKLIKTVLEENFGYDTLDVPNGVGAVNLLAKRKPDIDAAVLDVMMLGYGGSVKEYFTREPKYKDMPIIYHTKLKKKEIDAKLLEGARYVYKEAASVKEIGLVLRELLSKRAEKEAEDGSE